MGIRRSLLFMPGDDRHKIEKGAALGADSIIMDLEDGVAFNRKHEAREVIAVALREVDFGKTEKLIRINPAVGAGLYVDDIEQTISAHPDGYVLPKVESPHQIEDVSQRLMNAEYENNLPGGSIKLLAIIETARGIVNLREFGVEQDSRLVALIFGAEDLAGDIGAVRTPDGWEVFYARSAVVIHAKALGIQAIDTPYVHVENLIGLTSEAQQAHDMGYTGKLAIHPCQIEPIQAVFTPKLEEIESAKRLISEHHIHQAAGEGVFVLDGKMVDMPMVRAAELVIARARAVGVRVD